MTERDHRIWNEMTDSIHRNVPRLSTSMHALLRRNETVNRHDGYPTRTPGADISSPPAPPARPTEAVEVWGIGPRVYSSGGETVLSLGFDEWGWRCSCGHDHSSWDDPVYPSLPYASKAMAEAAAERHLSIDHGINRTISYADPTGDAATAGPAPDPVNQFIRRQLARMDRITRELASMAEEAERLQGDRPDVGLADPACESCARVPTYVPSEAYGTVGGRLKDLKHLCRWCRTYVTAVGKYPTREDVTAHAEGRRVRMSA